MGRPREVTAGSTFGRLTALEPTYKVIGARSRLHWKCRCECGGEALVESGNLRSGNSTQCGECAKDARGKRHVTHGHSRNYAPTKLYVTWKSMLARCENPKNKRYADYGGRGVTVCERWHSFENFAADMGDPPTGDHQIERVDNDKGYEFWNCRWATRYEQAQNKRNTRTLTYAGRTQTISEWAAETGIKRETLKMRLRKGWTAAEALQPGDLRRARS